MPAAEANDGGCAECREEPECLSLSARQLWPAEAAWILAAIPVNITRLSLAFWGTEKGISQDRFRQSQSYAKPMSTVHPKKCVCACACMQICPRKRSICLLSLYWLWSFPEAAAHTCSSKIALIFFFSTLIDLFNSFSKLFLFIGDPHILHTFKFQLSSCH